MAQKKRNPDKKISRVKYNTKDFENQVFTKEEQEENKIIEKAIHKNYKKKKIELIDYILFIVSIITFLIAFTFLISVLKYRGV